jgi:hypothetical protein
MSNNKYNQKIINKYNDMLKYMLNNYSRVLQVRFDGRCPDDPNTTLTSKQIHRFTDDLTRTLNRNNPLPEPGRIRSKGREEEPKHKMDAHILLVKEQSSKARNFHVHGIAFVNGQARKDEHYIQRQAEHCWNKIFGITEQNSGLLNISNQNGPSSIYIDQNKPDFKVKIQQAEKQALYLAKNKTKELKAKGSWNATGTRIK